MARYVDVSNLPNFEVTCSNGEKYILLPYEHLSDIPTADVAPRAEVAIDFAKCLIDKSCGGKIFVCDIPDLVLKYKEEQNK